MKYQMRVQKMLKVREVADLLYVHPNTVRYWTEKGIIKTYRINQRGDRRFRLNDIRYFLDRIRGRNSAI
jgi:excisionase family DNA binding protein